MSSQGDPPVTEQLRAMMRARPHRPAAAFAGGLDEKTRALVSIGAALAAGSPTSVVQSVADDAMAAGATAEDVVGVLLAVARTIGSAGVVACTSRLALAIGYDIDRALESTDEMAGG